MKRLCSAFLALLLLCGCTGGGEAEEAVTRVSSSAKSSVTVYVTKTGEKYHKEGCNYLKSKIAISLSDAKELGYDACSRCNPPK